MIVLLTRLEIPAQVSHITAVCMVTACQPGLLLLLLLLLFLSSVLASVVVRTIPYDMHVVVEWAGLCLVCVVNVTESSGFEWECEV